MRDPISRLDCSVVISTHNRCAMLAGALEDLAAQDAGDLSYEVIVVDNASTDRTREVIHEAMERTPIIRYLYEPVRGPASGRNTGIAQARGRIIAFTDDDNRIAPDWISALVTAFAEQADVDVVAGRILPNWLAQAPSWLTRDHWVGPLALQDYGDAPFVIDATRPIALSTANLAIRRAALDRIGWFKADLQRAEDTELLMRFWRAGGRCLYAPRALVAAEVQPERMTRRYHAWWHNANGAWTAAFDLAEMIHRDGSVRTSAVDAVRLWGIPAFVVREMLTVARQWLVAKVTRSGRALVYEHRIRFLWGYVCSRFRHHRAANPVRPRDVVTFTTALLTKKARALKREPAPPAAPEAAADTAARTQTPSAPTKNPSSFRSPAVVAIASGDRDRSAGHGGAHPTTRLDGSR